jgi:DNA polymerase III subunit delta'
MQFSEITGHDDTKATLLRAVQTNHVAHAQLFDGPMGSANLALALSFATYVNCETRQGTGLLPGNEPTDLDACGRCASCVKMQRLVHPDVHFVFPVANIAGRGKTSEAFLADWRKLVLANPYATLTEWLDAIGAESKQGNIPADEARSMLDKLSLKAYEGAYKIMLIWLPEFLNVASANALLKVLEEPPAQTLFLLVSNQPDKLLITILSRTQRVAVRAFSDAEVSMHLRQHLNIDEARADRLAFLANGDLNRAQQLSLADADADTGQHTWFADWMRLCYRKKLTDLVKQAELFDGFGREKQKGLFEYGLGVCRDMLLYQHGAASLLRLPAAELTFVRNFAGVLTAAQIERIVADLTQAVYHLERNARPKMILLDMSLTFARLIQPGS